MKNQLYYGDNLEVLRKYIKDETVDLCYIDPPFNSKRNYNQIYNNIGGEDRAQAQAFVDTWVWDEHANKGFAEILANDKGLFTAQTVDLLKGLQPVLKKGSLLAYLVSMTLRIAEIHRVLKPTGSFYLHCDPTASHYLKLILDTIFVSNGGDFRNEIIWHYLKWSVEQRQFVRNHDIIFFYSKSDEPDRVFNTLFVERSPATKKRFGNAKIVSSHDSRGQRQPSQTEGESDGVAMDDVWDISRVPPIKQLYPTEKPPALLERIIKASTNENDLILDAYCGCGTTIVVSEELKRNWIGVDITYQSISLILRRLEALHGKDILPNIILNGIPQDMDSARALALKQDDRVRKEFEKWAVLTYTNNRAIINDKKGGDKGIDGTAYFLTGKEENAKIVFQVKSGSVGRGDVAKLNNDRTREGAELAVFLTLQPPTQGMKGEASAAGIYEHPLMNRSYPRIQIVTIAEIVEQHKRLDIPMSLEVLKKAQSVTVKNLQDELFIVE
ncbi:MAG TPA: DNA methyltransferase [Ktedonobacteraceae bacterium]|nr:DNA methyltransferase [Ktedonobacteraceae bacterium]